jgi:hypothetical protein
MCTTEHASSTRLVPTQPTGKSPFGRRVTALDPVKEHTPVMDLRDVSMYLKHPISPITSTPNRSPRPIDVTTPSSLPPNPPSPSGSSIDRAPATSVVQVAMSSIPRPDIIMSGREHLADIRTVSIVCWFESCSYRRRSQFLSNSRNIWSLTALLEIFLVMCKIVPWKTVQV